MPVGERVGRRVTWHLHIVGRDVSQVRVRDPAVEDPAVDQAMHSTQLCLFMRHITAPSTGSMVVVSLALVALTALQHLVLRLKILYCMGPNQLATTKETIVVTAIQLRVPRDPPRFKLLTAVLGMQGNLRA